MYIKKLLDLLDSKQTEALKKSQRAWIKFRDLQFEFFGVIYNSGGTIDRIFSSSSTNELVRIRALELISYYDLIKQNQD